MAGKNHVERGFRILFDDGSARDLTGDLIPGTVNGGGFTFDEVDMTGVSESTRNFLAGHKVTEVTAQFHLNDTATTGAHTVLIGKEGTTGALELQWGQASAAPTGTDPEFYFAAALLSQVTVSMDGGRAIINAKWVPSGSTAPVWQNFGS